MGGRGLKVRFIHVILVSWPFVKLFLDESWKKKPKQWNVLLNDDSFLTFKENKIEEKDLPYICEQIYFQFYFNNRSRLKRKKGGKTRM